MSTRPKERPRAVLFGVTDKDGRPVEVYLDTKQEHPCLACAAGLPRTLLKDHRKEEKQP